MATYAGFFLLGMILLIWGNGRMLFTTIPKEERRKTTGGRVVGAIFVLIAVIGIMEDLLASK